MIRQKLVIFSSKIKANKIWWKHKGDTMAIMIPDKITRFSTEGEREVFYFLEE